VPSGKTVIIKAECDSEVAFCTAPADTKDPSKNRAVKVIDPASMRRSVRGKGTNTRYICDILPHDDPTADHLLVVEVVTPASHSSSYPPHKHDVEEPPSETLLEETYYHRLNPPQGFAFQRVYTYDRSLDEACAVENHDVVMVPRGYHPVTVPHGYDSYYLNVMAGPNRFWVFKNDPDHEWMLR
jgi:5-deoxy-glucuronate isomerase